MDGRDLLLEIGCEEIPSRFMQEALSQLKERAVQILQENRLPYGAIRTYGTPRRLVLFVEKLADRQEDLTEKVKGPPREIAYNAAGEPTKAAQGFARSQQVSLEQVNIEEINGKEYLTVVKKIAGEESAKLLPLLLPELIKSIGFSKAMYWKTKEVRFVRPIRWILSLYGADTVNFTYAGLKADRYTCGHRFLAPGPVAVDDTADYFAKLRECFVVLDQKERRDTIREQLNQAAMSCGGNPYIEEGLLEEVNFLVEYPTAVVGNIDPEFLELPREVLITAMQAHQRYFPVIDEEGRLKPHFITIINANPDFAENVRAGNEKVLRARLADARFFYEEDRKMDMQQETLRLKEIIFQEELGTLYDKVQRLIKLSDLIAEKMGLDEEVRQRVRRAASLCKTDLMTRMVREFPELQGVMGREYALYQGEEQAVAKGIYEHYLPRFAGDDLPREVEGVVLSLADKMDNIAGAFTVGIQPTGSQDPYALRRQSLGILYILLEHRLAFSLKDLIEAATACLFEQGHSPPVDLQEKVLDFFSYRLRYVLQERGIRYDVIDAVLAADVDEPYGLYQRARCLQELRETRWVKDSVTAYTRIANLAGKALVGGEIDPSLFREKIEEELFVSCRQKEKRVWQYINKEDFSGVLRELAALRLPVDRFFDEVLVMDENEDLRRNRLLLLQRLQKLFLQMADFNRIER